MSAGSSDLSPIERALVKALVAALVKEIRASQTREAA